MNIMLATVSERTGEIGIRRALGATKSDITTQFLVETSVLSASGAFIGAVVGVAAPPLISWLSGRETALTIWGPMIAVLVAMSTGLIFGIYPARRAATLDPIEALRRL
jgi:putative ABC transport system permease protein